MMLMTNATKTFSQWLTDNPTFYDNLLEAGLIDSATVGALQFWFMYRTICDDDRFSIYYWRQLNLVLPRYNKLIRLENTEFDALVSDYRERQIFRNSSETGTELTSLEKAGSGSDESTRVSVRTPNLTTTDESESSTSGTSSSTDTASTQSSSSTESNSVNVGKQSPQSISYESGVTAGEIPALNWSYMSAQQQGKSDSESASSSSSTNDRSADNTQDTETSNVNHLTGNDTTNETINKSRLDSTSEDGSKSIEKVGSSIERKQFTGRTGLTPQEALQKAMSYVKISSSFEWLKNQLEVCFLSIYDV